MRQHSFTAHRSLCLVICYSRLLARRNETCEGSSWRWFKEIDETIRNPPKALQLANGDKTAFTQLVLLEILMVNLRQTIWCLDDVGAPSRNAGLIMSEK